MHDQALKAAVSLLDKAQAYIEASRELLLRGESAASVEAALEAAKYLQLIRLLRTELEPTQVIAEGRKAAE
jgi:hypothetical protein